MGVIPRDGFIPCPVFFLQNGLLGQSKKTRANEYRPFTQLKPHLLKNCNKTTTYRTDHTKMSTYD